VRTKQFLRGIDRCAASVANRIHALTLSHRHVERNATEQKVGEEDLLHDVFEVLKVASGQAQYAAFSKPFVKQFDLESAAEAIVESQQVRREPSRNVMNAAPPQSIPNL
jgi:hypothetical protein